MTEPKPSQIQFTEFYIGKERTGLTIGIKEILFSKRNDYQHVQVWETDIFGRMLTLDGLIMLTEYDEFVYHEMITHPALCLLGDAERVLVIGGGDGGTVREILRHAAVAHIDLVEIDQMVIDVSREFFPQLSGGFDDSRLSIHIADGIEFVRNAEENYYDLIIVDSTDPVGIAEGLFGESFCRDCARILTDRGILVIQSESPFDMEFQHTVRDTCLIFRSLFPIAETYLAFIPTYTMGMWSFTMGSKRLHPLKDFNSQQATSLIESFRDELRYYNPEVHQGAFALPTFVRRLLSNS